MAYDNGRKYYECVFVAKSKYKLLVWECPVGARFDATLPACVKGPCPVT